MSRPKANALRLLAALISGLGVGWPGPGHGWRGTVGAVFIGDRLGAYGLFGCALILLCIARVQAVPMLKTSAR